MTGPTPVWYRLTEDDWHYSNRMVQSRVKTKPRKTTAELEGAAGEVAFARVFGLSLPEIRTIRGDGGIDFRLPSGATIDIKAISGENANIKGLLVPKRIRAGLYALVHINFDTSDATLLGWQTGGYAATHGEDKFDHWRLSQAELLPIERLYDAKEIPHVVSDFPDYSRADPYPDPAEPGVPPQEDGAVHDGGAV